MYDVEEAHKQIRYSVSCECKRKYSEESEGKTAKGFHDQERTLPSIILQIKTKSLSEL